MKCTKLNHRNVGVNNPMYGKKHSQKTILKMRLIKQGKNNPVWKGDKVGYFALHDFIRRRLSKPELCEHCHKKPPHDLANTGVYNRDFKNWKYLCRKCHMLSDGRMNNLKQFKVIGY